jgi:hypothetical protein
LVNHFWISPNLFCFGRSRASENFSTKKWIFHQSRTKTSTKTHIAKQTKKHQNHRLLVHNLHMTKQKKKKGGESAGWKVRP